MSTHHAALVERFYRALAERDHATMAAAYHPEALFRDPVFPVLRGEAIGMMWRMLCERGTDLDVSHGGVEVSGEEGKAWWRAEYTFRATGRKVQNEVQASFRFTDGLIVAHEDDFSFHRWARQALGPTGLLLGWNPLIQRKVQQSAAVQLDSFRRAAEA